jgi:protein O-GlcNAc transferase
MAIASLPAASSASLSAGLLSAWQSRFRSGDIADCEKLAREFVGACPKAGKAWQLLGASLLAQDRIDEALHVLRRAGKLAPKDWSIWDNFALALQRHADFSGAAQAFRTSLKLAPAQAGVWSNAAANQFESGNCAEALRLAREAIRLAPDLAVAHLNAGNALSATGRRAEAEAAFIRAVSLQPNLCQALLSLGREQNLRGNLDGAIATTRRALAIEPGYADAHVNLASYLNSLGDVADAAVHYRRALELKPELTSAGSGDLYCSLHDERLSPEDISAAHRKFGERIEAPFRAKWRRHANSPEPDRRLRLGFVSGDLRDHPVARFLEPVWRTLDRAQFELIAYDAQPAEDATSARLRAMAPHWTNAAAMPDAQLDARIRADRIDILFDLSGHTAGGRLPVFARRPAPIQMSWIGYPGTTGLSAIDYRLVDRIAAPPGRFDHLFTERLAYLPFMTVFDRPGNLPDVAEPPMLGAGRITFGSFNRVNKLGERTVELWARVLKRIPASRLLVGALPDQRVAEQLRQRFAAAGIGQERLELRPRLDLAAYLQLHNEVDILLDTLPFSSGTTANFALWMGVPTLTLAGNSLIQRLGASRMAAARLEAFVAESEDDYVDRAVAWSGRPAELARLRAGLREQMQANTISQATELARALEGRLREMWRRWCAGLAPERLL